MRYLDTIELVQNDTLPDIRFFIKDSQEAAADYLDPRDSDTWAAIDLSNKKAVMKIRKLGCGDVLSQHDLIPLDSANGEVVFVMTCEPRVFPDIGNYEGEVSVLNNGDCGEQTITERFRFRVIEEFV